MEDFIIAMSYVSALSVLIPISVYLIYPSYNKISIILSILILVALTADIANECFVRSGNEGYYVINTFFIIQFVLLSLIYHRLLINKRMIPGLVALYIILLLTNSFALQDFSTFQSWMRMYECVVLIALALMSYGVILEEPMVDKQQNYLIMWLNLAVIIYYFSSFYLFGISNYISKIMFRDDLMIVWGFHNVNNIIKNILFAIALFESGRGKAEDQQKIFRRPFF
ncbi:MAG: hypothetical protein ACKOW2_08050 [Sphingobacteriaceae bacterium]